MELERGNIQKPSGNLFVYCHVIGENPIDGESRLIASNVFVSFLAQNDTLPVVTFPPIALSDKSELDKRLEFFSGCDVHKLEDFEMPDDPGLAQDYIQTRLQNFHAIVNQYVEHCSRFLLEVEEKAEIEGIKKLEAPKQKAAVAVAEEQPADVLDGIRTLETLAHNAHRSVIASEPAADETYRDFTKAWQKFSMENPQYDLQNIVKFVKLPDIRAGKIIDLYFKKFRAIYFENYEEANELKERISELANNIN